MRAPIHIVASLLAALALATDAAAERVQTKTSDGFTLVGELHAGRPQATAVVLLHMYRSDRTAWAPLVPRLREAGYTVLALDQRAHGESTDQSGKAVRVGDLPSGAFGAFVRAGPLDVAAARELLAARGLGQAGTVLIGASYGCSVSLLAAAEQPGIASVVLLSPGAGYFGVDVMPAAAGFAGALRAVAAEDDPGSARSTRAIAAAHAGAEPPIVYRTGGHGTRLFGPRPEVIDTILEFLARSVGG